MNKTIHILDCLPGSGKSTSAIEYIKDNPSKKIILVCELLSEVDRYCDSTGISTPEIRYQSSKTEHAEELIRDNQSFVITHALFLKLNGDITKLINKKGYEIIVDEVMNAFRPHTEFSSDDFKILHRRGLIDVDHQDGTISYLAEELSETKYRPFKDACDTGQLVVDMQTGQMIERLPLNLFEAASKVTIMTFMFEGSLLDVYLKKRGFEIVDSDMKVMKDQKKYKHEIASCIKLCSHRFIDQFRQYFTNNYRKGSTSTQLSMGFYQRIDKEVRANVPVKGSIKDWIGKTISACARKSGYGHEETMYCVFKSYANISENLTTEKSFPGRCIRPKRLSGDNCLVPISCRGTNSYAHKKVGIYCVNQFINPIYSNYLNRYYGDTFIDEDRIALSNLIQWVFRGCVRNGEVMDVYIVSKRMEDLLREWL